ncbi:Hemin import ATP-binding protein HmuV [invertebrate metagenome]|uniref:Hemin import ATP-binding protein HmuV n=1 Tax=invertebrate metagenome TaxID=1711999 RepID=A0A2H9TA07_9ZZZZ
MGLFRKSYKTSVNHQKLTHLNDPADNDVSDESLFIHDVSVYSDRRYLLDRVSLRLKAGEFLTMLGPNGAGKSSLIKAIAGELSLKTGYVCINGKRKWSGKQKALSLGVLPQSSALCFSFSVEEVVFLGRTPCNESYEENKRIVCKALDSVGLLQCRQRLYTTLSGGEKKRVHVARVLAQIWNNQTSGARYLLLDEPVAALDPNFQLKILQLVKDQVRQGMGALVILHDLNLAARYSDRTVFLKQGHVVSEGTPEEVLTSENIEAVFDVRTTVMKHPFSGCPLIINC